MRADQEHNLIDAAMRGDLSAFEAWSASHERQRYAFAVRQCGGRDLAEDVVPEIMVRAWTSLRRFDATKDFRCWLFGIASHVCTDRLRRRSRRARREAEEATEALSAVPDTDPQADPVRASQQRELRELVAAALQELPPKDRAVLTLRYQHGLKLSEVAEALKTKPKAAEIRIRRAKAKLRPVLEPLFPELADANGTTTEWEGREDAVHQRSVGL